MRSKRKLVAQFRMKRILFYVFMNWMLFSWEGVYAQNGLKVQSQDLIVFMGNSITEGWPDQSPDFFNDPTFINKGVSGQTSSEMLARFRTDVLDVSPSIVVILSGTNDIAENQGPITTDSIVKNIVSMIELAKEKNIEVILCSVLPTEKFPWHPELAPAEKIIELNRRLRAYAEEQNLVYVDYFSAMVNGANGLKEELGYDGVHPNAKGYAVMEPLLLGGIRQLREN